MNVAVSQALIEHDEHTVIDTAKRPAPRELSPLELVSYAIQSGQPIDIIREAVALSKELKATQALEAFDAAVADAKAEIQPAVKRSKGHQDKLYADFAAYAAVVDPIIGEHGLSYRFRTRQDDRIHVTCVLSHRAGHREETTLSGPADTTGSKNAIQAIGSTLTYLQRYTLVQALGLAASKDDDGRKSEDAAGPINQEQASRLRALIEETDTDISKFCQYMGVEAVPEITTAELPRALAMLEKKKRQAANG